MGYTMKPYLNQNKENTPPKQTTTKPTTEKEFKYVETPMIEWVPGHLFILLPYPTVLHKNFYVMDDQEKCKLPSCI